MDDPAVPWDDALTLGVEPRLASWNRGTDPAQQRLSLYLDHVEQLVAPAIASAGGLPLALALSVGLPTGTALDNQRDLDNYLKPLVQRLGPHRFTTVIGRKVRGTSSVLVMPAAEPPAGAGTVRLRPTGSYERTDWKEQLQTQLVTAGATVLPAGPVSLTIRYTLGAGRNWSALWKPTIDSLTPLLGTQHPGTFNPEDGRITLLVCHQQVSPAMGYDVLIDLWWS